MTDTLFYFTNFVYLFNHICNLINMRICINQMNLVLFYPSFKKIVKHVCVLKKNLIYRYAIF